MTFFRECTLKTYPIDGWQQRSQFCCMIAGNKASPIRSSLELYSERIRTIRWFERHHPRHFNLFGIGWDDPPARSTVFGRIGNKIWRHLAAKLGYIFFPSYRGKIDNKSEVLQKHRFSICYENVRDISGYISEKIFDSFFSGCLPVYWGASNISDYVPSDCFIDRRNFSTHEELYRFMHSMDEARYIAMQRAISIFLQSKQARQFSAEAFAETHAYSDKGNSSLKASIQAIS